MLKRFHSQRTQKGCQGNFSLRRLLPKFENDASVAQAPCFCTLRVQCTSRTMRQVSEAHFGAFLCFWYIWERFPIICCHLYSNPDLHNCLTGTDYATSLRHAVHAVRFRRERDRLRDLCGCVYAAVAPMPRTGFTDVQCSENSIWALKDGEVHVLRGHVLRATTAQNCHTRLPHTQPSTDVCGKHSSAMSKTLVILCDRLYLSAENIYETRSWWIESISRSLDLSRQALRWFWDYQIWWLSIIYDHYQ